MIRNAQLATESVAVLCPYCDEPQPNKLGSEMWIAEDFRHVAGTAVKCVSCEKLMRIFISNQVKFDI